MKAFVEIAKSPQKTMIGIAKARTILGTKGRFAPVIVFWGLLAISTNAFMPKDEDVAEELAGPMVPHYAPSQRALLAIGAKFHESNSTSFTMIVLEGDRPLGPPGSVAHRYYDDLVRRLQQ